MLNMYLVYLLFPLFYLLYHTNCKLLGLSHLAAILIQSWPSALKILQSVYTRCGLKPRPLNPAFNIIQSLSTTCLSRLWCLCFSGKLRPYQALRMYLSIAVSTCVVLCLYGSLCLCDLLGILFPVSVSQDSAQCRFLHDLSPSS